MKMLSFTEHQEINFNKQDDNFFIEDIEFSKEEIEEFDKRFVNEKWNKLGIHSENLSLFTYYIIGYQWLKDDVIINVNPKINNNRQIDYFKIFLYCLENGIDLSKTYHIDFDKPWIDIETQKDIITPFIIIHFLKVVEKITKKGLKKGYIKKQANISSRVKGKILVNKSIKNLAKNQLHKTYCEFEEYIMNCIENQIIKTALLQVKRFIPSMNENKKIEEILKKNLSVFELIDTKIVNERDFLVKHSPFYKEYKEALNLAKIIFKRLGFSLNSEIETNKIPPFYINMPELFEKYVEIKLKEKYPKDIIIIQKGFTNYKLKPDFINETKKEILDAKYKWYYEDTQNKDDLLQLALYGRIEKLKKILDLCGDEKESEDCKIKPKLIFVYPKESNKKIEDMKFLNDENIEGFSNFIKRAIEVPIINNNK